MKSSVLFRASLVVMLLGLVALLLAPVPGCGHEPTETPSVEVAAKTQALTVDVTLDAVADTRVADWASVTNYGDDDELHLAGVFFDATEMSMVRFDPAAIQGAVGSGALEAATLEVTIDVISFEWGSNDLAAHQMIMPWTEGGATWLCANDTDHGFFGQFINNCSFSDRWGLEYWSFDPLPYESTPTDTAPLSWGQTGVVSLDVTADVQAMLDGNITHHGWLLTHDPGFSSIWADFHSRDSANPPHLVLRVADLCDPVGPDDTCDGIDDDCDELIDEAYSPAATTCGVGVCAAAGQLDCAGGSQQDSCTPGSPTGGEDLCDGLDDDCDGVVDEAHSPAATACGVGVCSAVGALACVGGSSQDTCLPGNSTGPDTTCDELDDDCNGSVDDAYASLVTNCGVGSCSATGSTSCESGAVVDDCTAGVPAASDPTCDASDDDCDGTDDEDYVPTPTVCGIGACSAAGTLTCVAGTEEDSCTPGLPAFDDITCDGLDDDCDGVIDDDYVSSGTTCGQGTCAASGTLSCQAGIPVDSCVPVANCEGSCTDGLDDDSDGDVDCDDADCQADPACVLGSACASADDCADMGGTPSCLDEAASGIPGGYCTRLCGAADPGGPTCPGGSECIDDQYCGVPCDPQGACSAAFCSAANLCGRCQADDASCDGIDQDCSGAADEDYAQTPRDRPMRRHRPAVLPGRQRGRQLQRRDSGRQ